MIDLINSISDFISNIQLMGQTTKSFLFCLLQNIVAAADKWSSINRYLGWQKYVPRKISHFQKKSFRHLKNASIRQYPSFPLQWKIHCNKMENMFAPIHRSKHIFHGDVKRYFRDELVLVVLDQNAKQNRFRLSFFIWLAQLEDQTFQISN